MLREARAFHFERKFLPFDRPCGGRGQNELHIIQSFQKFLSRFYPTRLPVRTALCK